VRFSVFREDVRRLGESNLHSDVSPVESQVGRPHVGDVITSVLLVVMYTTKGLSLQVLTMETVQYL
jgi:hypothetical protein